MPWHNTIYEQRNLFFLALLGRRVGFGCSVHVSRRTQRPSFYRNLQPGWAL